MPVKRRKRQDETARASRPAVPGLGHDDVIQCEISWPLVLDTGARIFLSKRNRALDLSLSRLAYGDFLIFLLSPRSP